MENERLQHGRALIVATGEAQGRYLAEAEAELTRVKIELGKAKAELRDLQRQRDRAQARANNAETRQAEALADSLLFAAESDERGALAAELVAILAPLSLAALVDCGAESIVALYSKAKRLAEEAPADRLARLRSKLEGRANG